MQHSAASSRIYTSSQVTTRAQSRGGFTSGVNRPPPPSSCTAQLDAHRRFLATSTVKITRDQLRATIAEALELTKDLSLLLDDHPQDIYRFNSKNNTIRVGASTPPHNVE